ncbi:MAG: alpha/beta fold hydrolase [Promethearchaeota archaeon]|nr:MAG: alpha/beta fold hydrolase [Candidatus Lokiarchaeota archaeon]
MVDIESIFIKNEEINLECEFYESDSYKQNSVIVVHPHPAYGGSMHNNVVSALFNILKENDVSCLRFNFRGVGKSNGSHTSGRGELNDVKACIDYLIKEKSIMNIFICGYSYGAAIGCSNINYKENVMGFAAISFPWDFMGLKYKKLSQSNKPKLFIQGDRDTIALYDKFMEHYEYYDDPKEYKIINGADHFYWGHEQEVGKEVLKFYRSIC